VSRLTLVWVRRKRDKSDLERGDLEGQDHISMRRGAGKKRKKDAKILAVKRKVERRGKKKQRDDKLYPGRRVPTKKRDLRNG